MVTKEKRIFFIYTILIAILVIIGFSLLYILKSRESYFLIVRVYIVIEYTLLAYFFSFYIKSRIVNKILFFSVLAYFLFCIYSYANEQIPAMPFLPLSVEHIILLCFIIYYFFEVMQEIVLEPIYQKAIFWISVAFIINSAGNFFLFLYSKSSYNDSHFQQQYTIIYTTVTVIKNILLCISILIKDHIEEKTLPHTLDINLDSFHPITKKS